MRKNTFLGLLVFLLFSNVYSGQTTLLGKISNSKGESVMDASVFLDTVKTNALSNSIGFFQVEVLMA